MPGLLDALVRGAMPIDGTGVGIVVAHPDDETIACGGLMQRLRGVTVVHATDGAPRDLADARRLGFSGWRDYAAARAEEAAAALDLAGIDPDRRVALGLPDQQAVDAVGLLATAIADLALARGLGTIVTHTYEGGHPDHDAVALAVHLARARARFDIIECPLYRLGPEGPWDRSFAAGHDVVVKLRLSDDECRIKSRMAACHVTQSDVLARFDTDVETFRPAPAASGFDRAPNGGRVLYEQFGWGLTWDDWHRRAMVSRRPAWSAA